MNWKKLKEFCNSLDEKQLQKEVIVWREDSAINNINTEKLEDDQYVDSEYPEEGCFPKTDAPKIEGELQKVYDKGDPVLWEEF